MNYQLVADIYGGLRDDLKSVIIKESSSLDEIESAFYDAFVEYSQAHRIGEFATCHLIVVPYSDEGEDIWPELSEEEQSRLSIFDKSIE
jgi:hypothetical protein